MEERNLRPISGQLITQSKDYIFPIEVLGKKGTCFFINVLVNAVKTIYLCINYDLITDEFVKLKGEINIDGKIIIKLDENTKIIPFKNQCKFIEIKGTKPDDKYILNLEDELKPEDYINEDAYLLCYYHSDDNDENKGGYISGKILNIDGYKIIHQFNTKNLLSVAPICLYKNDTDNNLQIFKVIGIQLENPDLKEYKYMSYGYLLKYVLKESNIEFNGYNNLNFISSSRQYEFLPEFIKNSKYSFYTFEEYKNSIIKFHIEISKYYKDQTLQNFNNNYNIVSRPEYYNYLKNLFLFKNISNNQQLIFNDLEIVNNLNKILLSNDFNKINKFSYFISGFMYVLNKYSKEKDVTFINDGDMLYTRTKLSLEELRKLDEIAASPDNKDKIITFKTFLFNVASLEHLNGHICAFILDFSNYLAIDFSGKFDTKIFIQHHFNQEWEPSCFSTMPLNYKIFDLFTFFKVNEVKINFEDKYAEINLELVGKNEIFEDKFSNRGNQYVDYKVVYDDDTNEIKFE